MESIHRPKWRGIDYVPEEILDLQGELARHPGLSKKLKEAGSTSFSETLGQLAAEFGIILDGVYTDEDIRMLCRKLTYELEKRRSPIIYQ